MQPLGTSGDNRATVNQSQSQKAHTVATGPTAGEVDQGQNDVDALTLGGVAGSTVPSPNQQTGVEQFGHTGHNDVSLNQTENQDGHAVSKPGPVCQIQGSGAGPATFPSPFCGTTFTDP